MKKRGKVLVFLTAMLLVLVACGNDVTVEETTNQDMTSDEVIESVEEVAEEMAEEVTTEVTEEVSEETPEETTFTLDELAAYNGQDGNKAYVAIDGVVYDVTGVAAWSGGKHNGNTAGMDVSEAIGRAPHGTSVVDDLEAVGILAP